MIKGQEVLQQRRLLSPVELAEGVHREADLTLDTLASSYFFERLGQAARLATDYNREEPHAALGMRAGAAS